MNTWKYLAGLLLLAMNVAFLWGQSSNWMWATSIGRNEVDRLDYAAPSDRVVDVVCDQAGNIYICGRILDSVWAGSIPLQGNGDWDIIVAKLNPEGEFLWASNLGGKDMDIPTSISLDAKGNAYLTGIFSGTVRLGGFSLESLGYTDIFVAKISSEGLWQWVRKAGSMDSYDSEILEGEEFSLDIHSDNSGNCVLLGVFHGLAHFGSFQLQTSGVEWFLSGIDSDGNWSWAVSLGKKVREQEITDVAMTLSRDKQIIIGGITSPERKQIQETMCDTTMTSNDEMLEVGSEYEESHVENYQSVPEQNQQEQENFDDGHLFLAKYNSQGTKMWEVVYDMESDYVDRDNSVGSIVTDSVDNIYFTGNGHYADFGSFNLERGYYSYIACSDSLGRVQWLHPIANLEWYGDSILNLAVGGDSTLYLVSSTSNLVSELFSKVADNNKALLISSDKMGNILETCSFGEETSYIGFEADGIAIDRQNNVIVTGSFGGSVSIGENRLISDSKGDAFIIKYRSNGR